MKALISIDATVGPMSGHFRTLAIPAAVGMVFNTLYNMVDIYFAGRLATSSQAGVAIGFMVFFLFLAFGMGLNAAISALVGGELGARNRRAARRIVGRGATFTALLSLVLMAAGFFLTPLVIALITEPGPYRDAADRYLLVLLLAIPGFLIAHFCNGALQAQGDTRSLTRALIVAFFGNIVLNPLLIYGLPGIWGGIGFDGVAVSTVLSQSGVALYMMLRLLASDLATGFRLRHFRPHTASFTTIAAQMLPTSFSLQVMIIAGFVVQYALKDFGAHAIAAYGVGLRIEQLLLLPVLGLSAAFLPIAAQNFGARRNDRVRAALRFAVLSMLALMALACPVLWIWAPGAMRLFSDDPDVIRVGATYLRFDGVLLPVYGMLFLINAFLQALKRPIWVLWISIYRQGFGVLFFVWLYLTILDGDVWNIWLGIGTSVVSGLVLSLLIARHVALREIGGLISDRAMQTAGDVLPGASQTQCPPVGDRCSPS